MLDRPIDSTEDDSDARARATAALAEPQRGLGSLTLVFEGGKPCIVRPFSLRDVGTVTIGRASQPGVAVGQSIDGARRLTIQLNDRHLSQVHAHVRRVDGGWSLEDAASKNGTRVNGAAIGRALLKHGDLVELGRSFLVFRNDRSGIDVPNPTQAPVGLRTMNPDLAAQFGQLATMAASNEPILVHGETGTGKELVAKAVHEISRRRGPLRAINCGALPRSLIESELFGYRKGAFSGASEDRPGLVRSADKGTLFLDEIGDLPFDAQTILLRVLQEKEVVPVGAANAVPVDFRVVAATHRDLDAMVAAERFRTDLRARLAGFVMRLPPLRERREDLGALVQHLVEKHAPTRATSLELSPGVIRLLFAHEWKGNIRELERVLATALILSSGGPIELEHLRGLSASDPIAVASSAVEPAASADRSGQKELLVMLMVRHKGNVTAVASELQTSRMQVHRLCRRYGVSLREYRSP